MTDTVIVDGFTFWETHQGYYLGNVNGKARRLHIYVWEKHHGKIPKGYCVHHIDHDKSNNDISNLTLMSIRDHQQMHAIEPERMEEAKKNILIAVRFAVDWHKSDDGREWHKLHAKEQMTAMLANTTKCICQCCGKEYETPEFCVGRSKFCSESCKRRARTKSGRDNINVKCPVCGGEYVTDKYSRKKYCSDGCRLVAHESKMRNRVRA